MNAHKYDAAHIPRNNSAPAETEALLQETRSAGESEEVSHE
jgi:hypothetical protein